MHTSVEDTLARLERRLSDELPGVKMEFASQTFTNHVELLAYVLTTGEYQRVADACRRISAEEQLEQREPEVWLMARNWTGPWPGGESEEEIRRRREEFMRRHNLSFSR